MGVLGILGIFIGIIIGLFNFNIESIDISIFVLLGGLKIVFIISIVGMFFVILFNGMDVFFFVNKWSVLVENNFEFVIFEYIYYELKE